MITVRFPNGQAVQYNAATHVARYSENSDLFIEQGGQWIAYVPNTCMIEVVAPCRVYNALQEQQLESLTKEIRALRRKLGERK